MSLFGAPIGNVTINADCGCGAKLNLRGIAFDVRPLYDRWLATHADHHDPRSDHDD